MSNYHEPAEELSQEARDFSRALNSLKEEIEAVDWYHQRIDITEDESLKKILAHNRDEEIEHACMTIEWLRRKMPGWDEELRTYLFTEGEITELEEEDDGAGNGNYDSLGIGRIKK
ncbi:MAG: encapsulin-associated ferritin-like protein [Bacteroidota bacterium]